MTKELNTLLTALYVLIDDHVVPPRTGRGRRPELTDSELITLAVAQMLQRYASERRWIRHIHADPDWRAMFPAMLTQSGYHKRLKTAQPLLCRAILTLAACCPSWFDDLWITDATPVPCGMSRETVKRSDLAGHAGYGYCASHSRWYWASSSTSSAPGTGCRSCGAWPLRESVNARCWPRCSTTTTTSSAMVKFCWRTRGSPGKPSRI
ncbi:hypothetical protein Acsp05_62830 [Actinokineospora sp. NBRC 105648]|nr:hypothetical protein Acsp05_62830 [Actinokineospora sp. NBRC 105648]